MGGEARVVLAAVMRPDFSTTHWSVVLAASDPECPRAAQALETLCLTYWYPVYAYVRRVGFPPADAEDLTQEFFARLLAHGWLSSVDPERGKFRWFLLAAIKRFLSNERKRASALKRGGACSHAPLDEEKREARYQRDAATPQAPDSLFDRAWATDLIQKTYEQLENEYALEGKARLFARLRVFLSGDKAGLTYAEIGAGLRMTEGAVKVAVHRLRRRYRTLLREQVGQTVRTETELEEELRDLQAAFAG